MSNVPEERDVVGMLVRDVGKLGLPEKLVGVLPPLVVLFAVGGLPAAGIGVLTAMTLSEIGRRKMRDFSRTVEVELGVVEGQLRDEIEDVEKDAENLRRRVDDLDQRLRQSQVEQLGRLFEEYMRSLDGEWLTWLRAAAKGVVSEGDSDERHRVVIGSLRSLTPAHVRELLRLTSVAPRAQFQGLSASEIEVAEACHSALLATGFVAIEEAEVANEQRIGMPVTGLLRWYKVTHLGQAALDLLVARGNSEPDGVGRDRQSESS